MTVQIMFEHRFACADTAVIARGPRWDQRRLGRGDRRGLLARPGAGAVSQTLPICGCHMRADTSA
jgi:hypothetical protein